MKTGTRWIALLALAALGLGTARMGNTSPAANPAWDKLKTLVGEWNGTYAGADAGDAVRISYRLVSNGTSLMETLQSGHDTDMVTIYHLDGNRILATHYCAIGNQPRLAASGLAPDGRTLTFRFVDASNVGPDSELMQGLVVTFDGPDRFAQAWTSRAKGKDQVGTFTYTRVPQ